jgi:hypothetical protein
MSLSDHLKFEFLNSQQIENLRGYLHYHIPLEFAQIDFRGHLDSGSVVSNVLILYTLPLPKSMLWLLLTLTIQFAMGAYPLSTSLFSCVFENHMN